MRCEDSTKRDKNLARRDVELLPKTTRQQKPPNMQQLLAMETQVIALASDIFQIPSLVQNKAANVTGPLVLNLAVAKPIQFQAITNIDMICRSCSKTCCGTVEICDAWEDPMRKFEDL